MVEKRSGSLKEWILLSENMNLRSKEGYARNKPSGTGLPFFMSNAVRAEMRLPPAESPAKITFLNRMLVC